jgi:hypothetical protein
LWFQLSEAIFSLKVGESLGIDATVVVTIDTSESCVWLKVSHSCQNLPYFFNRNLLLSVVTEDFP